MEDIAEHFKQKRRERALKAVASAKTGVKFTMNDGGVMVFELYPEVAPVTVMNFLDLVQQKFYDGLTIHRIAKDVFVQGGCPVGDGTGLVRTNVKGEFKKNGVDNNIKHVKGVISMARGLKNPNSAGSQFFIMLNTYHSLDGSYAAFGKIVDGIEVLDNIAQIPTDTMHRPLEPVVIKSIVDISE